MENTKLGIIDIDGLFYHSARETLEESIQTFKDKFQNILDKTSITHYIGFYSQGRYFRHNIFLDYKIGRVGRPVPKFMKALKEWAIVEYGLQNMYLVEADDLTAFWINKNICSYVAYPHNMEVHEGNSQYWNLVDKILITPDKDLLESIPGQHFNYTYKLTDKANAAKKAAKIANGIYEVKEEDVIKGWWIETSEHTTNAFKNMQLIVGDSGDGIKGIEGKGAKYWERMESKGATRLDDVFWEYIENYGHAQGIFEFQKNYRLLHLLDCNDDFVREIGEIPTFPNIVKVAQPEESVDEKIEEKF